MFKDLKKEWQSQNSKNGYEYFDHGLDRWMFHRYSPEEKLAAEKEQAIRNSSPKPLTLRERMKNFLANKKQFPEVDPPRHSHKL